MRNSGCLKVSSILIIMLRRMCDLSKMRQVIKGFELINFIISHYYSRVVIFINLCVVCVKKSNFEILSCNLLSVHLF